MKMGRIENNFYVYVLMDPRKPGPFVYQLTPTKRATLPFEPFYVGKGSGRRSKVHAYEAAAVEGFKTHKHNKIINILRAGLFVEVKHFRKSFSETEAFVYEKLLIRAIGRFDLKTGPLTNLSEGGTGNSGLVHSVETRQQMSRERAGRKLTEEHKQKIGEGNRGKIRTAETRRLIGENSRGRKHSAETRARISSIVTGRPSPMKGKTLSSETRQKISKALMGKAVGRRHSEQTKAIISAKGTGRRASAETKAKLSAFQKNRARSPESAQRIAASRALTPKALCPHCARSGDPGPMKRWHFDNCRFK